MDFDNDSKAEKKPKKKLTNFFDERPSDEEDDDNNEFPRTADGADDDDDDDDASDIDMEITWQPGLKSKVEEKFRKAQTTTKETRKSKEKKRDTSDQINVQLDEQEDASEDHRESLALLTVDDEIDDKRDFNLRQMIKEHKQSTKAAAKKEKKSKKSVAISSAPLNTKLDDDSFHLNVDDQRFQAVYSRAAFNIDQTDPHFKATAGTQRIIDEKLKKRKLESGTPSSRTEHYDDDIVRKLKKKSAEHNQ